MTECGAYYGTGQPAPYGAAICRRPEGHPPVSEDGIGHAPYQIPILSLDTPTHPMRG